jgi:hypothetical protein
MDDAPALQARRADFEAKHARHHCDMAIAVL